MYFTAVCRVEDQQQGSKAAGGGRSQEQERSLAESSLSISVAKLTEAGQTYCKVRIQCDSMELASDLVQDIARQFGLTELDSEADFPAELSQFEEVRVSFIFCVHVLNGFLTGFESCGGL